MSYQLIKAGINLYAIFKNLEDLIALDEESRNLIKGKKISIQFLVKNGPKAWLQFENETCKVGQGIMHNPSVKLWFKSPEHLNKMFDGEANPIPLKGFTKLGFLQKEFVKITEKLEYYLKPEKLENPSKEYIEINTRFTLTVAAFALPEIVKYNREAKLSASHIPDGKIQLWVLPNDPAVFLTVKNGEISAQKGTTEKPDAIMEMKDYQTANNFLNGKSNPFLAIAIGDVIIRGQTNMLDSLSLILDKVQNYV
ncbi:MAG: hypothetical protein L3J54_06675 [Draconibacterium sp.]|nr:hypothetical protein [Draconibacterium sp.]